ncbi:hypothetical protein [Thalassospira lucentensis]|uniref:Uncharacterized protein n=1 Tax=Thalassospira lucentensis TaxID=168935 RepID=A0A358HZA9_9PROT|nr:hypothetical protein [Thalassospira lucentensis]HBV00517.1 hypothetical protein [Thalassospira lucentensis]HCW66408.1 hypothetical protein [Thalassospira lucentensis]
MIFEDKVRNSTEPRNHTESSYEFLDRSARAEFQRVRNLLNGWIELFPSSERDEMISRICSNDERHFNSATFEMLLFALFTNLDCHIEVHPQLPNNKASRPDFLVTFPDDSKIYVEAVLASEFNAQEIAARHRTDALLQALDGLETPEFFIGFSSNGHPDHPPSGKKLRHEIVKWLADLDPDSVSGEIAKGENPPQMVWEADGWTVQISAFPKSPERHGTNVRSVGAISTGVRSASTWQSVRDAVRNKGTKYGELELPLLVAVNVEAISIERIDEMQALFGQETFVIDKNNLESEPRMQRLPNGAWVGPRGLRNKRVSGVWIFENALPWNLASRRTIVYHHPKPRHPLPMQLREFDHALAEYHRVNWKSGRSIRELLQLPNNWPER